MVLVSLSLISTFYHGKLECQQKNPIFFCQEILTKLSLFFVPFGMGFAAMRKSLWHKHLRRAGPRNLVASLYATRVYAQSLYSSVQPITPPTQRGILPLHKQQSQHTAMREPQPVHANRACQPLRSSYRRHRCSEDQPFRF